MIKQIVYLFSGFILISCGNSRSIRSFQNDQGLNNQVTVEPESLIDSVEIEQVSSYQASRKILTDLIHTKLEVSFDWNRSRLNGVETLTAKPHFYSSDSLILDAKGMDILAVQMSQKALAYTYDSSYLKIKLDKTYNRDEQFTVVVKYTAKPEDRLSGGGEAITSDKGLFFINAEGKNKQKMPQIWTQGETESASVWFPTIDSPNSKSSQETYITVDAKYRTLSNGKLISSRKNPDGTRTDYWKQDLPHAPYLFMLAVGEFKVVSDSYTRSNGQKMEVNYFVEPEWESSANAIFGETPEMIAYFSELLEYEFPWDKYSQIVVRDYVSGAMENTGAVVFGDYVYKTDRELLDGNDQSTIAHELFHHWFGDLVTCESWSNLPLNESFANYSQYLWDEHRYGLDEADYQAEQEVDGYYQSAQAQGYHPLIWFDYQDREQMFDGHSYNKGGRILHMLRNYLGDEAFFKGISLYLHSYQFKSAEFHQLRLALEEVSGEDLNWFFNQWFLESGHPILDIIQYNNQTQHIVTVDILQKQNLDLSPIYKLPLEIAIYDDSGKHIYKVIADQLTNSFKFSYTGKLACVLVDQQQMLLAKVREDKPVDQLIFQYYNSNRYKPRREALLRVSSNKSDYAQQVVLDALHDRFWAIRKLAIEQANKLNDSFKGIVFKEIHQLCETDSNSFVRSAAIEFLAKYDVNPTFETLCLNRIEQDRSYMVIASALRSLAKFSSEKAILKAKLLEKEKSSRIISEIAQLYGEFGDSSTFDFFETTLKSKKLSTYDEVGVMNEMTLLLSRQTIDFLEKSIDLYHFLEDEGGTYTKMLLPQNISYLIEHIEKQLAIFFNEQLPLTKAESAEYKAINAKISRYSTLKSKLEAFM